MHLSANVLHQLHHFGQACGAQAWAGGMAALGAAAGKQRRTWLGRRLAWWRAGRSGETRRRLRHEGAARQLKSLEARNVADV